MAQLQLAATKNKKTIFLNNYIVLHNLAIFRIIIIKKLSLDILYQSILFLL